MPAINVRELRPIDVCRLVNSTPLGTVLDERRLYNHRVRAGFRIGDGRHIDLVRYTAWVFDDRHTPKPHDPDPYGKQKYRAASRSTAISRAGREIGDLPVVVHPDWKARAMRDFRFFCETYFPITFSLAWSPDHLKVIAKIEQAVLEGGLFSMAMPRGSGKTTISECACIWAVLNGHREFVCLIGSDEGHAMDMLESIKTELEGNGLLLDDYPESIFPIQSLEGIANRASGQLYNDERTYIGWTAKEIVLPSVVPAGWLDDPAMRPFVRGDGRALDSGAIIKVAGITGRIRGMKFKRSDGESVRPSLVVIDDPQTDESARSLSQCATRESILAGAVLGLAGPGKKIAGVMPCTVIHQSDMADNILDRSKHPEWNGERTKMVYSFPTNETLWAKYREIRVESLQSGNGGREATEFYAENREAMDEGSVVAWPERHNYDELSAIQHAMNLQFQDRAAFFAEYQNEPLKDDLGDSKLSADMIANKLSGLDRRIVPQDAEYVVGYIDVHERVLYWVVSAWSPGLGGGPIDYGTYPEQGEAYFTQFTAMRSMQSLHPGLVEDAWIVASLDVLVSQLTQREFQREDGATMKLQKLLIDVKWGEKSKLLKQFCRRQPSYPSVLFPAQGLGIGASSKPFDEYKRQSGVRVGQNWRIPPAIAGDRWITIDVNWWKSQAATRLLSAKGTPGCWELFGRDPTVHRLFADHCIAEEPIEVAARGRVVLEWKWKPGRPDNHYWDCLVGSAVAGSLAGCGIIGHEKSTRRPRQTAAEMLAAATRGR